MQARFSTLSSLAAHHRRLMASCAESGCRHVRQRSDAKLSARTVGESPCMSKSIEAHYKGQIVSARDLPTGCQQQCSLVVPTVRAPRCLIEPSAKCHIKRPEREPSAGQRAGCLAQESKSDPKGGDESLRKLHESLVHNNQHATRQRHGQQNRSGSTRRGDRCCHVGGLGRRTNLCAPLRFGLHRPGHELAAC
jgi:hypothetical protein